ncbi:MAG: restriction endonuclease subunit S [Candidatus Brocadiaceae bacterium]|nr:restriction endonuclease subunit S [Candidatus Brocadiaceae bacterium]
MSNGRLKRDNCQQPTVKTQLKKGYKQTEVGIIPSDWVVKLLGEIVYFLDDKRRPIKDSNRAKMKGQYPYYGASGVIDFINDYIFDEELILLGEDGENILSRNVRLVFKINGKVWVNNHAHVLKPKEGFDVNYLTEKLESFSIVRLGNCII